MSMTRRGSVYATSRTDVGVEERRGRISLFSLAKKSEQQFRPVTQLQKLHQRRREEERSSDEGRRSRDENWRRSRGERNDEKLLSERWEGIADGDGEARGYDGSSRGRGRTEGWKKDSEAQFFLLGSSFSHGQLPYVLPYLFHFLSIHGHLSLISSHSKKTTNKSER